MKATIKDVAKLAGVSFKTVSRVVNNVPSVKPAIKEKVLEAIKTLNYQPNLSARHLRGAPSSIGFIYDNPNANYVIGAQQGILAECRKQGFELVIYPCDAKADNLCDELTQMVTRSGVGGLLITPPVSEMPDVVAALRALDVKFVRILSGSGAPDDLSPCVFVDDRDAALDITRHLVELGHRNIAFLCGDEEHRSNSERLAGYKDALTRHGIPISADLVIDGKFSFESGVDRTRELLARAERPSAIFACNDEIAAGALFAARMMGLEVPKEVSIAGFEDNPFSRQTWPKLTTARQSTEAIAQTAAQLLIDVIRPSESQGQGETKQQAVGFHPELVIRDSTCPAS